MTKGTIIKTLRKAKKLTQTELADMIKTTKQNIYKYENDIITNIPSDKIQAMADVFGVSPAYIMGWNDEKNAPVEVDKSVMPDILKSFSSTELKKLSSLSRDRDLCQQHRELRRDCLLHCLNTPYRIPPYNFIL